MSDTNSDEDMFITQNVFRQADSDNNIDLLHEILFGEERLQQADDELSTVPIANAKKSRRVILPVSDAELEKRCLDRIPEGTKHNTNWAVRAWREWAEIRNSEGTCSREDLYAFVQPQILDLQKNDEINYWLAKFVVEIRKKKPSGEPYPPNTLYQLCCGIQRYFRENGRPELNLFQNACFKKFQDSLDGEMKRLTAHVKEAQAFTEEREEKLWNLKLLGCHSAQVLLDTMVFLIGRTFALRSGKEHRNLRFEQFTFK
jgi:hypothetical protein